MNRLDEIKTMPIEQRRQLLVMWINKERIVGMKTLDVLFSLDDLASEIYNENRIKKGFSAAQNLATEEVLKLFF